LQNVLGYSALASGAAMIPAALAMLVAAPISALLIVARGSQVTLLAGYTFCALELLAALVLWKEGSHPWQVAVSFILLGTGVGPAGTPSSHSLTGSVPVSRVAWHPKPQTCKEISTGRSYSPFWARSWPRGTQPRSPSAPPPRPRPTYLAHTVGIIIVILGALLVLVCFPRKDREIALLAEYASADAAAANS